MIDFKKPKHTAQPAIYFISLHANNGSNVTIWNAAVAAYTPETAHSEAVLDLKEKDTALFNQGQQLGGWKVQQHIELTGVKIDNMLTRAYDARDEIEKDREKLERNELMETIVDTASRKLLNKYRELFTDAEVAYMENEIQKYDRTS